MESGYRNEAQPYRPADISDRLKHAAVLALLSDRRYRTALDAGCAEGSLTRQVAPLCDRIVALDISETAVWRAMVNLADVPNVSFVRRNLRDEVLAGGWDLIVVNGVLPHLDAGQRFAGEMNAFCSELVSRLAPGGRLLVINQFGNPSGFRTAVHYQSLLREEPRLKFRQEVVTGGLPTASRHSLSLFERLPAAMPEAVPGAVPAGAPALGFSSR